jgi:hypothetical protein
MTRKMILARPEYATALRARRALVREAVSAA